MTSNCEYKKEGLHVISFLTYVFYHDEPERSYGYVPSDIRSMRPNASSASSFLPSAGSSVGKKNIS